MLRHISEFCCPYSRLSLAPADDQNFRKDDLSRNSKRLATATATAIAATAIVPVLDTPFISKRSEFVQNINVKHQKQGFWY